MPAYGGEQELKIQFFLQIRWCWSLAYWDRFSVESSFPLLLASFAGKGLSYLYLFKGFGKIQSKTFVSKIVRVI